MKGGLRLLIAAAVASGWVGIVPPPAALAVDCVESPAEWNYGVGGGPSLGITSAQGVRARSEAVDDIHLEPWGGAHIESLYLWYDASNMVEFGWAFERYNFSTNGPFLFGSLLVDDEYFGPRKSDLAAGAHHFAIEYNDSTNKWDFKLDGNTLTIHRDPTWAWGRPFAVGEIANQCDDGRSHWWDLQRQGSTSSPFVDWTDLHWNCDQETDYGFKNYTSDTSFWVKDVDDTYTGQCDPFS